MSKDLYSPVNPFLKKLSRIFCVLVFLIACLVLLGYITRTETLKRLLPDAVAVNPLTVILLLLSTTSLWFRGISEVQDQKKQVYASRLALTVIIISFSKFLSFVFNFEFYLDTLLFRDQLFEPARNALNRMAPNTAFCFFLSGMSLYWLDKDWKGRRPAQYFSILITFIALLSIYGYIYGVRFLYGVAHYIPMSLITAISFFILSMAILFARPEKGTMAVIIGDTSLEVTLLRFSAFLIPLVMGWLKLKGEKLGYFSTEFGTALFAICTYALAMLLLARRSVVNYRMRLVKSHAAEEVLRAHHRFLQFFQLSPEVRTISGLPDGRMMYVNKAYEDFFGIKAADAIGKTALELKTITSEQQNLLRETLRNSATVRGIEAVLKNAQGELRNVYIDTTVIDLDERKCLLTNVLDITEKKQAEVALAQQEQMLRLIVDNIGEGLAVMNRQGDYLVLNKMAQTIIRQSPTHVPVDEVASQFGLFYPDTVTPLPKEESSISRSFRGLHTDELELFIRNPNIPEGKFIVSTGRPIYDAEGNVIAAVTIFRDDTRRRALESLLSETENKLQEVMAAIGEGVVICNTEGKFILFNRQAQEIMGRGELDISPADWPSAYHLYKIDGVTMYKAEELSTLRALKGEVLENIEVRIIDKENGVEKNLLVSSRPVYDNRNNIIAAVTNIRDVTQIKLLEHLLNDIRSKYNQLVKK